jgi:hypothetical protein
MTFTNIGSDTAGRIYDVNETARLEDFANRFNTLTEQADQNDTKKKDTQRYIIIGVGSLLIFGLLTFAYLKNKK